MANFSVAEFHLVMNNGENACIKILISENGDIVLKTVKHPEFSYARKIAVFQWFKKKPSAH